MPVIIERLREMASAKMALPGERVPDA